MQVPVSRIYPSKSGFIASNSTSALAFSRRFLSEILVKSSMMLLSKAAGCSYSYDDISQSVHCSIQFV